MTVYGGKNPTHLKKALNIHELGAAVKYRYVKEHLS